MIKNQVTSSKDGTTLTTFNFVLEDDSPPTPPEERRHQEIQRELRSIRTSIDGLCIIMFLIGIVFLLRGCGV